MTRRLLVGGAVVIAAVLIGATMLPSEASDTDANPSPASEPVSEPVTIESVPAEPLEPLPSLPDGGLELGSEDPAVEALERRLQRLRFDPGPIDESFDGATEHAVMAFEKLNGMAKTGRVDPLVWTALESFEGPDPLMPEGGARRIEIDLERQLLFAYDGNEVVLISHISSGSQVPYCENGSCGNAITPVGAHRFMWRVNGWRTARLGRLYNPVYFTAYGIAVHGSGSVPTYPASHGCVRIPMHIAEYFPSLVEQGDPVYVLDGVTEVQPISATPTGDIGGPGRPAPPEEEPADDRHPEPVLDGDPVPTTPTTTLPPGELW